MTQPFFSIITICLNEEPDLHLTANSVVKQTCKDYEWLVIDGGSTDGTLEILQKYKKNMSYFISEKDNGIYGAMNKGVKKATGKYIIFMNGGDLLYGKNVLQKVYDFIIKDKEAHAIYHGECLLHNNDIKKAIRPNRYYTKIFRSAPSFYLFFNTIDHQAAFVNRRLFKKYGNFKTGYRYSADYDFFIRTRREENLYMHIIISYFNMDDNNKRFGDPRILKEIKRETNNILRKNFTLLERFYYRIIKFCMVVIKWIGVKVRLFDLLDILRAKKIKKLSKFLP